MLDKFVRLEFNVNYSIRTCFSRLDICSDGSLFDNIIRQVFEPILDRAFCLDKLSV